MDEYQSKDEHRRKRLQDLVDKKFSGSKAATGRALGYKDGAFVGQMLRGERPITEKTIEVAEALPGAHGWFSGESPSTPIQPTPPSPMTSAELLVRLGQVIAQSDELTRAQIKPILDQLLKTPEQAAELGRRLEATIALRPGGGAQPPAAESIADEVIKKKLTAESRDIYKQGITK